MLLAALPILIELFTSEGCSSCPPADAVLARLHEKQPVPGVQLLILSEHVDYWNDLGWRDPFSDALFSDRQRDYGARVYTPQAVVDGRVDVVGSDEEGILRAARAAAQDPHGTIQIVRSVQTVQNAQNGQSRQSAQSVQIFVAGLPPHGPARVMVAVLEDGLVSRVARGENQGRTLSHTAVVRGLKGVGTIAAGAAEWRGEADLDPGWKPLRLIVFVQDRVTRKVLAAAAAAQ
jgi:hypothetical protein